MRERSICILMAFFILSLVVAVSSPGQEKKETGDIYTIKPGDTLWDLSEKFLKDPFQWPKLWQRNQYITNPHWIYPGKPLRLSPLEVAKKEEPRPSPAAVVEVSRPPEPRRVEAVVALEGKPEPAPEQAPVQTASRPSLRPPGFIGPLDFQGIGIVVDAREGKNLMASGDIVFITFKTANPVSPGDLFTLVRASETVRNPLTGQRLGIRFNYTAVAQIIDQSGKFYSAKIVEDFDAVSRGNLVLPFAREKLEVGQAGR